MSEINVKVRSGTQTLYDTKVLVELDDTVRVLKQKLCEKDNSLHETLIEIVYCGSVMENGDTIHSYNVFDGATVHAFKTKKYEAKPAVKTLSEYEMTNLGVAFRHLAMNLSYKSALTKQSTKDVINSIIRTVPGLSQDPVAITLLHRSELLGKFADRESVKRIAASHPALACGALEMASSVHSALNTSDESHLGLDYVRNMHNSVSDEDLDDIDDSSPASEASGQPVSSTFPPNVITTEQLATAIASVTAQQPQPSTSGASTSTGITQNALGSALATIQNQQRPSEDEYEDLQIMNDMGFDNNAINLAALRASIDLDSAMDLILSGFGTSDNRNNTQN